MIMSFINHPRIFICLFFLSAFLRGQENFTSFIEPRIAFNYKLSKFYGHNWQIANRSTIYESSALNFNLLQFDIGHFSSFKIGGNQSLSLGLLYRYSELFEEESINEFRITEQYNIISISNKVRYGNRIRAEQRITSLLTIYRFRYRFTLDLPLEGQNLDVGESYFIGNAETLLSVGKYIKPIYGQRFTANLGWLLSSKTKLQFGLEYRLLNFTRTIEHRLLLLSSLNFSL
mgnify:CR=1 FL=1